MPDVDDGEAGPLCWAAAGAALAGETESGDIHLVRHLGRDLVLLAVIDGLGHGPEAAEAAAAAVRVLHEGDFESVTDALEQCHDALHHTRGVVMTLAAVDTRAGTMEWLGVGNVDATIIRGDRDARPESVLLSGGVIGYQLPRLRPRRLQLREGDMVVFATDGIGPDFATSLIRTDSPSGNANRVLKHHQRDNDDALVLVACWRQEVDR